MMNILSISDIRTINDEPRILDMRLALSLGFEDRHKIRNLIQRNIDELRSHGEVSAMVAETSSQGGRPGIEYHLNEAQALLVCMFSRTERAAEVRRLLIEVFMAWRNDADEKPLIHQPRLLLPGHPDFSQSVRLVREARLSRGATAALAIWRTLGLPWVEELEETTLLTHNQEDVVARFSLEGIERTAGIITPAATIWRAFCEWCHQNQIENPGRGLFQTRFGRMGFSKRKSGGRIFYIGIRPALGRGVKTDASA